MSRGGSTKYNPPKPTSVENYLNKTGQGFSDINKNARNAPADKETRGTTYTKQTNINLESAVEFSRWGASLNLENLGNAIAPAERPNPFDVNTPELPQTIPEILDIFSEPGVIVPSILRKAAEPSNLTNDSFLFCDPRLPLSNILDECVTCIPNPSAILIDWTTKENEFIFFDPKECRYSIVLDSGIVGQIDNNTRDYLTRLGIEKLLNYHSKASVITVIYYVPTFGTPSLPSYEEKLQRAIDYLQEGGRYKGETLGGNILNPRVLAAASPTRIGFDRIAEEFQTVDELYPEARANIKVSVPIMRNMTTKVLVSVKNSLFEAVPDKILTSSEIEQSLKDNQPESTLECTIRGGDLKRIVNFVSVNLKRSDKYLDKLQADKDSPVLYRKSGNYGFALDAKVASETLKNFIFNQFRPVIRKLFKRNLDAIDNVIFGFVIDKTQEIPIISFSEITVTVSGCQTINMSKLRNQFTEIDELFSFRDQVVLGYLAVLPDMDDYLQGVQDPNWIEFLAKFTFPGLEVRDPTILLGRELPENLENSLCIIDMPINKLVNKLIATVSGLWKNTFGSLTLGGVNAKLCKTYEESLAEQQVLSETKDFLSRTYSQYKIGRSRASTSISQLRVIERYQRKMLEQYAIPADSASNSFTTNESVNRAEFYRQALNDTKTQIDIVKTKRKSTLELMKWVRQVEKGKEDIGSYQEFKEKTGGTYYDYLNAQNDIRINNELKSKSAKKFSRQQKAEQFRNDFNNSFISSLKSERERLRDKPLLSYILKLVIPKKFRETPESDDDGVLLVENSSEDLLDDIFTAIAKGGGWCAWVRLFFEATQCIAKGLDLPNSKEAILRAALAGLDSYKLEKVFRNLPPDIRNAIKQEMTVMLGSVVDALFVWETDWNINRVFDADKELEKAKEEIRQGNSLLLESQQIDENKIEELAFARVEQQRASFIENRQKRVNSGTASASLANLITETSDILIDLMIKYVGVETLFDMINDLPGIGIVQNILRDKNCYIPEIPLLNPPLGELMKSLKTDLCSLTVGFDGETPTLPALDPPLANTSDIKEWTRIRKGGSGASAAANAKYNLQKYRKTKRKAVLEDFKLRAKDLVLLLLKTAREYLIDFLAQLLVQAIVSAIEATLDVLCNTVALGVASLADLINRNGEFREKLKKTMCPNSEIGEEQFLQGLSNIMGAVYANDGAKRECVSVVAGSPELASYIDSIIVTLSYNQLVDLISGNASPETLTIITQLAINSGSECIANIFGDPGSAANFWDGIGTLIDAPSVFELIPPGTAFEQTAGVCPPQAIEMLDDFRAQLLQEKGLTPEQIQDQLDFLKDMAANKLEDLYWTMTNGPFNDIPTIVGNLGEDCPATGLITYSPDLESMSKSLIDSILDPVEARMTKDLIGVDGAFSHILSDTYGKNLQTHKFLTDNFGNSLGQFNTELEYYSNNFIKKSTVENGFLLVDPKARVDQFGIELVRSDFDLPNDGLKPLVLPSGGYPVTIGAWLMNKYINQTVGYIDTQDPVFINNFNPSEFKQDKISFSIKRGDPNVYKQRKEILSFNQQLINYRKEFIAIFCLLSQFIDANVAAPYISNPYLIPGSMTSAEQVSLTSLRPGFDETIKDAPWILKGLKEQSKQWGRDVSYDKRVAYFLTLIEACSNFVFDKNLTDSRNNATQDVKKIITNGSFNFNNKIWTYSKGGLEKQKDRLFEIFLGYFSDGYTNPTINGYYRKTEDGYYENINIPYQLQLLNYDKFISEGSITINGVDYSSDTEIKIPPFINPYEIGMSYLTYPKMKASLNKKKQLKKPEWGFELTYELTIEDENAIILPEFRDSYRVTLVEKLDPFREGLNKQDRQELEDYYASSVETLKNQSEELQNDGSGPISDPLYTGQGEYLKYSGIIKKSIDSDVKRFIDELLSSKIRQNYTLSIPVGVNIETGERTEALPDLTIIDPERIKYSYESETLKMFLLDIVSRYTEKVTKTNKVISSEEDELNNKLFETINTGFLRRISKRVGQGDGSFEIPEFDNNLKDPKILKISEGFRFGYDPLVQPEIIVLDPARYGGSPEKPPYYIKPPDYSGWLGIFQKMVPEEDGCEPKRVPISSFVDIKKDFDKLVHLLNDDSRLSLEATCTEEAPYDAIFNGSSLAAMDSIIRATIRTHVMEIAIKIMPLITQFKLDFEENFDNLMVSYATNTLVDTLKTIDINRAFRPVQRKVLLNPNDPKNFIVTNELEPRLNYYYGFLEQAVNIVLKKLGADVISYDLLTEEEKIAINKIFDSIEKFYEDYQGTEAVLSEEAIASKNILKKALNPVLTRGLQNGTQISSFNKVRAKRIKNAINYATLKETEEEAKIVLGIYIREEVRYAQKILNDKLKQPIDSLDLLFLSSPEFINGHINKIIDEFTGDVISYSGPYDVQSDPLDSSTTNIDFSKFTNLSGDVPVDLSSITPTALLGDATRWPFVLERYVLIQDKERQDFKDPIIADIILNRDSKLKGFVNLIEFDKYVQELLKDPRFVTYNMWDLFGNIIEETITDSNDSNFGKKIKRNNGLKFGLRLSMVFGEDDKTNTNIVNKLFENRNSETAIFGNFFQGRPTDEERVSSKGLIISTPYGDQYLIPVARGELEVKDMPIRSYNSGMYDLICLVPELRESIEFRTMFGYLFPYKRYLSLYGIYTINSFLDSIGNAGKPSEGGDRWTYPGGKIPSSFRKWDKDTLFYNRERSKTSTLETLMVAFMTVYRTRNEYSNNSKDAKDPKTPFKDLFASIRNIVSDISNVFDNIDWHNRKNIVDRPFDGFERECSDFEDID